MSTTRSYYEKYWADPSAAPPSNDPTTAGRKDRLKAALAGLPAGASVLDVGCGAGEFTEFVGELSYDGTGIDLSERAVQFAKLKYPRRRFRVGTPEEFMDEFAGTFAAVWTSEVIEHIFDVYAFLISVHRVLIPGGRLILTTPYHGFVKDLLIEMGNYHQHYKPFGGHIRFFNKRSLGQCLNHCGFTVRKWSGIGRVWPIYKSFFVVAQKTHDPAGPPPADS